MPDETQPVPEDEAKAPAIYVASAFHEIPCGDGTKRVEVGFVVVSTADGINAYPPADYLAALPAWPPAASE